MRNDVYISLTKLDSFHSTSDYEMACNWFISKEEFAGEVKAKKDSERILNWLELARDRIYSVMSIEEQVSVKFNRPCWILHLTERDGKECAVWGPTKLITDIKERRKSTERPFIVALGQEAYKGKTFNKYDLVLREMGEEVALFKDA